MAQHAFKLVIILYYKKSWGDGFHSFDPQDAVPVGMVASFPCRIVFVPLFSNGERQLDFFLFFPGTVVVSRCFEWGADEILHLGDIKQSEAVKIPLGPLGHFRRELLRYIARLTNPAELARTVTFRAFISSMLNLM